MHEVLNIATNHRLPIILCGIIEQMLIGVYFNIAHAFLNTKCYVLNYMGASLEYER